MFDLMVDLMVDLTVDLMNLTWGLMMHLMV